MKEKDEEDEKEKEKEEDEKISEPYFDLSIKINANVDIDLSTYKHEDASISGGGQIDSSMIDSESKCQSQLVNIRLSESIQKNFDRKIDCSNSKYYTSLLLLTLIVRLAT